MNGMYAFERSRSLIVPLRKHAVTLTPLSAAAKKRIKYMYATGQRSLYADRLLRTVQIKPHSGKYPVFRRKKCLYPKQTTL